MLRAKVAQTSDFLRGGYISQAHMLKSVTRLAAAMVVG